MRRLYFGLLILFGCILLALFQNVGRLSHNEKPKSLLMPQYFVSIYESQKNVNSHRTMNDYEGLLYDSPLYKRLLNEITIKGGSKGCDPSDPHVICPPQDQYDQVKNKPSQMSVTFDPLRSEARMYMFETWQGKVNYNQSSQDTHVKMSRMISSQSEVNFEYNQNKSTGKVSFELKW